MSKYHRNHRLCLRRKILITISQTLGIPSRNHQTLNRQTLTIPVITLRPHPLPRTYLSALWLVSLPLTPSPKLSNSHIRTNTLLYSGYSPLPLTLSAKLCPGPTPSLRRYTYTLPPHTSQPLSPNSLSAKLSHTLIFQDVLNHSPRQPSRAANPPAQSPTRQTVSRHNPRRPNSPAPPL
jgi:hypothetical protein